MGNKLIDLIIDASIRLFSDNIQDYKGFLSLLTTEELFPYTNLSFIQDFLREIGGVENRKSKWFQRVILDYKFIIKYFIINIE
jgi:hypothetical protein